MRGERDTEPLGGGDERLVADRMARALRLLLTPSPGFPD